MQLEFLVPVDREQPSKTRRKTWYASRGHHLTGEGSFADVHPGLPPLLAPRCAQELWREHL